jgi:ankyrin repeat protein
MHKEPLARGEKEYGMRSVNLCRTAAVALLFLTLGAVSGCGAVHSAAVGVATVQLPPGKLYSSDFYANATPDEVRAAIGGRSLAGESYTKRYVAEHSSAFLGKGITRTVGIFIPNTYLGESRLTPLNVALRSTDNLEVIKVLLEAGAAVDKDTRWPDPHAVSREMTALLLQYATPVELCKQINGFAAANDKEWLDYCFANIPTASPNCETGNGMTPFLHAAKRKNPEMVRYFLEKGADITRDRPLYLALHNGNVETADILLDRGCALLPGDNGESLLRVAVMAGKIRDEALLKRLAAGVPLTGEKERDEAVQAACYSGNTAALSTLLSRGATLRQDVAYEVDAKSPGREKMLKFLAGRRHDQRFSHSE